MKVASKSAQVKAHQMFLRHRRSGLTSKKTRTTKEILSGKFQTGHTGSSQRNQLLGIR